jgi:hypothetical protein
MADMVALTATMQVWVVIVGFLLALVVILVLIDRIFAWIAKNATTHMRNDNAITGGMRNVMGAMEEFVHPEIRHVHEEMDQRKAERGEKDPSDR